MGIWELYAKLRKIPQSGDKIQMPCGHCKTVEVIKGGHLAVDGAPWCEADLSHASLFRGSRFLGCLNLKENN